MTNFVNTMPENENFGTSNNAPFQKKKKSGFIKIVIMLFVILLIVASGIIYYYQRQLVELKQNPQKISQEEVLDIVERVNKIMVLPEGEQPTLATVADLAKLKDQPFFAKAQVGDKVLLYTQSRKAILYSPTTNKIVEVAPINIGDSSALKK